MVDNIQTDKIQTDKIQIRYRRSNRYRMYRHSKNQKTMSNIRYHEVPAGKGITHTTSKQKTQGESNPTVKHLSHPNWTQDNM